MKTRIFPFLFTFLFIPLMLFAQKDVTTFLGIPVDGYKSEMRKKLINKGFSSKTNGTNEYFVGEFNGVDVNVYIATNNNKVFRIMLCDAQTLDEADIKVRFNKLVSQFERNQRYISASKCDQSIPNTENISYEMNINKKVYEAVFYQRPDTAKIDDDAILTQVYIDLSSKYSVDQLVSPTEEIQKEIISAAIHKTMESARMKPVWFKIISHHGEYYIALFYDNEYNHADGEDL